MEHQEFIPASGEALAGYTFAIEFPTLSRREAADAAPSVKAQLEKTASETGEQIKAELIKARRGTQDLGTIVGVVLSAKATIAAVAGLVAWMRRRNQARVILRMPNGTSLEIDNMDSDKIRDLEKVLTAAASQAPRATL